MSVRTDKSTKESEIKIVKMMTMMMKGLIEVVSFDGR